MILFLSPLQTVDGDSFLHEARSRTLLALVLKNPQDCDADLSDDEDRTQDPDCQPAGAGESGDTSLESVDEEEELPHCCPAHAG